MFYDINYNQTLQNNLVLPRGHAQPPKPAFHSHHIVTGINQNLSLSSACILQETQMSAQGLQFPSCFSSIPIAHHTPQGCPVLQPGDPTHPQPDSSSTSETAFQAEACQTTKPLSTSLPWWSKMCLPLPLSPRSPQQGHEWCHTSFTAFLRYPLSWPGGKANVCPFSSPTTLPFPPSSRAHRIQRWAGNLSASASRLLLLLAES